MRPLGALSASLGTHVEIFQVSDMPTDAQNALSFVGQEHYNKISNACVHENSANANPTAEQRESPVGHRANRSSTTYTAKRTLSYAKILKSMLNGGKAFFRQGDRSKSSGL